MVFRLLRGIARADRPAFALLQSVGVQVAVLFVNLATGVVTARLLGPDGRGIFTAISTWPHLLSTMATAGLTSAMVFNLRRPNQDRGRIVGAGFTMGFGFAALAIAAGVVMLPHAMTQYDAGVTLMAQVCLLATFVNVTHIIYKQVFAGIGAYRAFNVAQVLPPAVYLTALLIFAATVGLDAKLAAVALLGGGALAVLAITPSALKAVAPQFKGIGSSVRDLWSFTRRAAGADFVGAISAYADRLLLIPMISAAELGLYVVAYSFSRTINVVQPAVSSVIFSSMSHRSEGAIKTMHDHAFRFALYGLLAVIGGLMLIDRPLLTLVYGAEFGRAAELFRVLILEAALGSLCYITSQVYLATDRPGYVSVVQSICFGVSVTAMLVLIPHMDALGAAYALLIAAVVRLVLLFGGMVFYLRLAPTRLWPAWSDIKYLRERLS